MACARYGGRRYETHQASAETVEREKLNEEVVNEDQLAKDVEEEKEVEEEHEEDGENGKNVHDEIEDEEDGDGEDDDGEDVVGEKVNEEYQVVSVVGGSSQRTVQNYFEDDEDEDDDVSQPLQPEKMFFDPSHYMTVCKIGTRCSIRATVEYLEGFPAELKWFKQHEQFRHVFHMPREPNHMLQGMWMLLLRTTSTDMLTECWFVVNGTLIRYSIREHALLTGFSCLDYPKNYKQLGDVKFAKRVFGRLDGITVKDVEVKLKEMKKKSCSDMKKLAILYFLCKIVKSKSKANGNVDSFLLRIVDDVSACENFPWGRYTFDDCLKGIRAVMKNMKGSAKPKAQTGFSGFIVPLEILAFECIPVLRSSFRTPIEADVGCPRMCKHKFNEACMRGFSLEEIYKALGSTKDITSILEPDTHEKALLARIVGDDVDDGIGFIDPVVDKWKELLIVKRKKIWWKDLYEKDLESRSEPEELEDAPEVPEKLGNVPEASILSVIQEIIAKEFEKLAVPLGDIDAKVDLANARLCELDVSVKDLQKFVLDPKSPPLSTPFFVYEKEDEAREKVGDGNEKEGEAREKVGDVNEKEGEAREKVGDGNEKEGETREKVGDGNEKEGEAREKVGDGNEKDQETGEKGDGNEKDQENAQDEDFMTAQGLRMEKEQEEKNENVKERKKKKRKTAEESNSGLVIQTGKKRERQQSYLTKTPYRVEPRHSKRLKNTEARFKATEE